MAAINAKIMWQKDMHFTGMGSSNNFPIAMDDAGKEGEPSAGASPMELVLIGLGGCTGMDVISILTKMRQEVTAYEVRVHGERAPEHPRYYTSITVEHVVTGHNLDPEKVERAVRLSETKYCSVSATLAKGVQVRHICAVIDEDSDSSRHESKQ